MCMCNPVKLPFSLYMSASTLLQLLLCLHAASRRKARALPILSWDPRTPLIAVQIAFQPRQIRPVHVSVCMLCFNCCMCCACHMARLRQAAADQPPHAASLHARGLDTAALAHCAKHSASSETEQKHPLAALPSSQPQPLLLSQSAARTRILRRCSFQQVRPRLPHGSADCRRRSCRRWPVGAEVANAAHPPLCLCRYLHWSACKNRQTHTRGPCWQPGKWHGHWRGADRVLQPRRAGRCDGGWVAVLRKTPACFP